MRGGRIPLFVLLASAVTFLVSLFMPWIDRPAPSGFLFAGDPSQQPLTLFEGGHVEGWVSGAGDVAVLLVISLVLATLAALRNPQLAGRLPIGSLAVGLGYFAGAVVLEVHMLSPILSGGFTGTPPHAFHVSWTYGFYLGLVSAGVALLSGLAYRRGELLTLRGAADAAALILGLALLGSFLLPWIGFGANSGTFNRHGIESPAAAIAALALILGAGWLHREPGRRWRLPVAIGMAVLTGGAASAFPFTGDHLYGTWIGVGCAVSLVALEAARAWPARLPVPPQGPAALRTCAAVLLLVALFLPWQELHATNASGRTDGWYLATGAAAGALCLLLLAAAAVPALEAYVLEAVVAIVIFVSTVATNFRQASFFYRIGYGAWIGSAAAGSLLVTALAQVRPGHVDRRRALVRAVPLAASVLCVAAVVVPSWFVLPEDWTYQAVALYGWVAVPGVLISLYLVRLWARRVHGPASTGHRLTLTPIVLLTFASLELIRFRHGEVIWGAVIVVVLCLLLAVLGWIEEHGGLEGFRVREEFWRVDRLPEPES